MGKFAVNKYEMKLYNFFKPTKWKIILFLALAVIFVSFIKYDNGIRCFTTPCPSDTNGSILMWAMAKRYAGVVYEIHYNYLLAGLIATYVVACLIVSIINKIKK